MGGPSGRESRRSCIARSGGARLPHSLHCWLHSLLLAVLTALPATSSARCTPWYKQYSLHCLAPLTHCTPLPAASSASCLCVAILQRNLTAETRQCNTPDITFLTQMSPNLGQQVQEEPILWAHSHCRRSDKQSCCSEEDGKGSDITSQHLGALR